MSYIKLRPYQDKALRDIKQGLIDFSRVLFQLPTAGGKTILFSQLIADHIRENENSKILIVAETIEVLEQNFEKLSDIGIIDIAKNYGGNEKDFSAKVQIASSQSLNNEAYLGSLIGLELIVIDEAHHCGANTYSQLFDKFKDAKFLGVTATPFRHDDNTLGNIFNKFIQGPSIKELIPNYLSNFKYVTTPSYLDKFENESILGGEFDKKWLKDLFDNEECRANVINAYRTYVKGNKKKGIVYAINKEHARNLVAAFEEIGIIVALLISGETNRKERKELVERFRNGKIQIIVNVDIATEGFDCKDLDFVILARPTRSLIAYIQQIGRVLRKPDYYREPALIIDTVGLYQMHLKQFGSEFIPFWEFPSDYWEDLFNNNIPWGVNDKDISFEIIESQKIKNKIISVGNNFELIEIDGINIDENKDDEIVDFFPRKPVYELYRLLIERNYSSATSLDAIKLLEADCFESIIVPNYNYYKDIGLKIKENQNCINGLNNEDEITNKTIDKLKTIFKYRESDVYKIDKDAGEKNIKTIIDRLENLNDELKDEIYKNGIKAYEDNITENKIDIEKDLEEIESLQSLLIQIKEASQNGICFTKESIEKNNYHADYQYGDLSNTFLNQFPSIDEPINESFYLKQLEISSDLNIEENDLRKLISENIGLKASIKAFERVLKLSKGVDKQLIKTNLKDLYFNTSDFCNAILGVGKGKFTKIKKLIENLIDEKLQQFTGFENPILLTKIANENIDNVDVFLIQDLVLANDLQRLEILIKQNKRLKDGDIHILNHYKPFQIFKEDLYTGFEISQKYSLAEQFAKNRKFKIESDVIKMFDLSANFCEEIITHLFSDVIVFNYLEYNKKYCVNFTLKAWYYILSSLKVKNILYHDKLTNIYFIPDNCQVSDDVLEQLFNNRLEFRISTNELEEDIVDLLKVIINSEFSNIDYNIQFEINSILISKIKNIDEYTLQELVLLSLNQLESISNLPNDSTNIYNKVKEFRPRYDGEIRNITDVLGVLSRENIVETQPNPNDGRSSLYSLNNSNLRFLHDSVDVE